MLEGIPIVLGVIIKLIRVGKEIAAGAESITAADVRTRQTYLFGLLNREDVLRGTIERFAYLIADIGIGVLIGDDLYGILHARGTMIGGQHECETQISCLTQQFIRRRMPEPTEG